MQAARHAKGNCKAAQRLAAALGFFALVVQIAGVASAGDARIVEEAGPDRLVIETNDSTVDEILKVLAARFGFSVEQRAAPSTRPVRFTGRLLGSLDGLLERILRHDGHIIVRSTESKGGISRVVFLDAKGGATPVVPGAGPAGHGAKETAIPSTNAPGAQKPAQKQTPQPAAQPALRQPPAVVDSTSVQLEEIGRQVASMEKYRQAESAAQVPWAPANGAAPPALSMPATGSGYEADVQRLTQQAAANVQALVSSLRAICLGPSCTPR